MTNVCLPGDVVESFFDSSGDVQIVGRGLVKIPGREDALSVNQPGIRVSLQGKQWIDVSARRYVPAKGDYVLGVVVSSQGDFFRVDIGAVDIASLHYLSFEGATKRNRPNLRNGDLIYAKVFEASKHAEAELTCVDETGRARGMGALPARGFVFRTSLNLVRRILSPSSQLLAAIGDAIKYEITCGLNGRVWVDAREPSEIVTVYNIIEESEFIRESDIPAFVEQKIQFFRGCALPA